MDIVASTLGEYGPWGIIIFLLIAASTLVVSGKVVPLVQVNRWLDDKDKIIERSIASFEKLSDAVEKNTDSTEVMADELKAVTHALESIQRAADKPSGVNP